MAHLGPILRNRLEINRTYSPLLRREQFKHARTNSIPKWNEIPFKAKLDIRKSYEFDVSIGEGAEGFVLSGYEKENDIPIAAKLVSLKHDLRAFALLETKLLAATNHAAVPLVLDLFQDEDYIYIIQEYVRGKPIFDLMAEDKIAEEECKIIVYQLLDLLDYLHEHGIIHGDIKPDNIIFNRKTQKTYLLDFGSAQTLTERKESATGGSIGYIAPEILMKEAIMPQSDIWSLGVLLYTMITGYPPFFSDADNREEQELKANAPFWFFNNDDTENLRNEILLGEVDFDTVSPMLADLLQKMFQLNTTERISARDALSHPWLNDIDKSKFNRVLRNPDLEL